MHDIAPEVVSIADACLGGLQGRSALLIGNEAERCPYIKLLRRRAMKHIYEEDTPSRLAYILPHVQLLISAHATHQTEPKASPLLTAADIAKGCIGRHTPLLILDLSPNASVEEIAGLLPAVCLYTPDDLRQILDKAEAKAS